MLDGPTTTGASVSATPACPLPCAWTTPPRTAKSAKNAPASENLEYLLIMLSPEFSFPQKVDPSKMQESTSRMERAFCLNAVWTLPWATSTETGDSSNAGEPVSPYTWSDFETGISPWPCAKTTLIRATLRRTGTEPARPGPLHRGARLLIQSGSCCANGFRQRGNPVAVLRRRAFPHSTQMLAREGAPANALTTHNAR